MEKCLKIRIQLQDWKVNAICLQESKLELISLNIIRCLWGCNQVGWILLPPNKVSGGILVMWDRRVVGKIEDCVGDLMVVCSLKMLWMESMGICRRI